MLKKNFMRNSLNIKHNKSRPISRLKDNFCMWENNSETEIE